MKMIRRLIILILLVLAFIAGFVSYQGYDLYQEAIEEVPLSEKVLEIQSKENYTNFDDLPETYVNAIVAVEDKRFFYHRGFDPIATFRALKDDIESRSLEAGGSTITQQLAKNMYFDQSKKLSRKIAELFVARDFEKTYKKNMIFELYVNAIYFGETYYCVYDAAQGYFGIEPSQMDDYQATMLAGIPNAPAVYAPTVNPDLAEERRQQVIQAMVENGYIEEGDIL